MKAATTDATRTQANKSGGASRLQRPNLPVSMAAVWAIALFLGLPAINRIGPPPPAAVVLTIQIVVSLISLVAASVLLFRPRKRWLLLTIPLVTFLVFVTGTVWTHFP